MKSTIYGVVGHTGKLGSLLVQMPNFVPIDCDITDKASIKQSYNGDLKVIINCAAISSVDECESEPVRAYGVNVRGANYLMEIYGNKVLNLSSDMVFSPWWVLPPTERSKPFPVNAHGMTKVIVEDLAINTYGAKVIRLSRTLHPTDWDMSQYFQSLRGKEPTEIPAFFYRNYLTRTQAVTGIVHFVNNWDTLPNLVNYGLEKPTPLFPLMQNLANRAGFDKSLLVKRKRYDKDYAAPRPTKSGFSVVLAKKLGFPIFTLEDVVNDF